MLEINKWKLQDKILYVWLHLTCIQSSFYYYDLCTMKFQINIHNISHENYNNKEYDNIKDIWVALECDCKK